MSSHLLPGVPGQPDHEGCWRQLYSGLSCVSSNLPRSPTDKCETLPNAYHVPDLKEIHTLLRKPENESSLMCCNCDGELASHFCRLCCKLFCPECKKRHRQHSESSEDCEIILVKDMTSNDFEMMKILQGSMTSFDCSQAPIRSHGVLLPL